MEGFILGGGGRLEISYLSKIVRKEIDVVIGGNVDEVTLRGRGGGDGRVMNIMGRCGRRWRRRHRPVVVRWRRRRHAQLVGLGWPHRAPAV